MSFTRGYWIGPDKMTESYFQRGRNIKWKYTFASTVSKFEKLFSDNELHLSFEIIHVSDQRRR